MADKDVIMFGRVPDPPPEMGGEPRIPDRILAVTGDGRTLVPDTDPEAEVILFFPGKPVPPQMASRYDWSRVDGSVAAEDSATEPRVSAVEQPERTTAVQRPPRTTARKRRKA